MRLLLTQEYDDQPHSLRLVDKYVEKEPELDEDIVHYAILSHRWLSDDEEVSFADVVGGKVATYATKRGYWKIRRAMHQAFIDGWIYLWVDTWYVSHCS